MSVDEKVLLEFLAKAHRNTYAAPKEIKVKHECKTPVLPGHKDYHFINGDLAYHDSYTGSSWAPGREVVFFKDRPVWCMSYQGQTPDDLSEDFIQETFEFLKKALHNFEPETPFRGPKLFKEGDFEYRFNFEGDYKYFTGRESVTHKGKEVFFQDVMGSLVKF